MYNSEAKVKIGQ